MKVSSSSILSLVLALNGAMASPLKARGYEVVTVTELTTEIVHVTSTTWVDPARYAPTSAPNPTPSDGSNEKKSKNHFTTSSSTSVSISETLAKPTVSSSISELSVVPTSTLAYSSVETTQQTTLSTTSTSVSSTSTTSSIPTTTSLPTTSIPTTTSVPTSTPTPTAIPTYPQKPTTLQTSTLPIPTTPTIPKTEPTTSAPAPAPSVADKSVSTSGSSDSHSGQATYFDTGMGSCGIVSQDTQNIAAISHLLMDSKKTPDPNKNPFCGTTILCSYKGGPEVPVIVVDRCTGCAQYDLDLSPAAFDAIGAKKEDGRVEVTWRFKK